MSTRSQRMHAVVAAVAPELKGAGFRKQRHLFNRSTEPGVVQVVDFQMAQYRVPPGMPVPPALVDGSFRLNLGVYVDALVRESWERPPGKWVSEYRCQIRAGMGELLQGHAYDRRAVDRKSSTRDIWWSLADVDLAADAARSALRDHALPWLDRLATKQAVTELREREEESAEELRTLLGDDLDMLGVDPEAGRRIVEKMALYKEAQSGFDA